MIAASIDEFTIFVQCHPERKCIGVGAGIDVCIGIVDMGKILSS
jgi:hypothetical protein